ncbi:tetracycline resistance efflux system leader peptide [Chryseobacterium sp. sg2396]
MNRVQLKECSSEAI